MNNSSSQDDGPSPAQATYINQLIFRGFVVKTMAIGKRVPRLPRLVQG
jgi:hypothetical protein